MDFKMRMDFNGEYVVHGSFHHEYINGKKNGFAFEALLGYYRGHYLSDIDTLEVYLDGEKMPDEAVTFALHGKEMPVYKLKYAVTEFWNQTEPATIRVIKAGGVSKGDHELDFRLILRIPYMQIGPDHTFMPLDSGEKLVVTAE